MDPRAMAHGSREEFCRFRLGTRPAIRRLDVGAEEGGLEAGRGRGRGDPRDGRQRGSS